MGSAEIGQELVDPAISEGMQEKGTQDVARHGNGVGTRESAARELRGVPWKRREHVTFDTVHREDLMNFGDRVDAVVALGIDLVDVHANHARARFGGEHCLSRIEHKCR